MLENEPNGAMWNLKAKLILLEGVFYMIKVRRFLRDHIPKDASKGSEGCAFRSDLMRLSSLTTDAYGEQIYFLFLMEKSYGNQLSNMITL